jgi:hypothetical protein
MKIEDAAIKILENINKKGDEFSEKRELLKIRIGKNKIDEVLNYLSHKGLIVYSDSNTKMRISPATGRDFIASYKSERMQRKYNGILAITGAIIALTAIYEFFMSFDSLRNNGIIKVVFIVLIFACFASIVPFVLDYWKREVFGYD